MKGLFEEETLHCNYVFCQFFLLTKLLHSEITLCLTIKIQNPAIEMCATCIEFGLHSLHSGCWDILKSSSE